MTRTSPARAGRSDRLRDRGPARRGRPSRATAGQDPDPARATLDTAGATFAGFLVGVIVIVGGLIYFLMLILGPIGERITG
jgi:hypothetical protein